MAEETPELNAEARLKTTPSRKPACTVLLVEDNRLTSKIVKKLLIECQYSVLVANNGREALDVLNNSTGRSVDVILTDNFMPEVGGIELIEKVAQSDSIPSVPIVVMSARSDRKLVDHAFKAGALDFFFKPVKREELQKIRQLAKSRSRGFFMIPGRRDPVKQEQSAFKSAFADAEDRSHSPQTSKRSASDNSTQSMEPKKMRVVDQAAEAATIVKPDGRSRKGAHPLAAAAARQSCYLDSAGSTLHKRARDSLPGKVGESTALARAASAPHQWDTSFLTAGLANMLDRCAKNSASCDLDNHLEIRPLDLSRSFSSCPDYKASSAPEGYKSSTTSNSCQKQRITNSLKNLHHSSQSAFTAIPPQSSPTAEAGNAHELEASSVAGFWPLRFPASQQLLMEHNFAQAVQAALQHQSLAIQQQSAVKTCAATRKAALEKFRAKRQQRNFDKKVRYASRKRLADTRPRVRGQFVRADVLAARAEVDGNNAQLNTAVS